MVVDYGCYILILLSRFFLVSMDDFYNKKNYEFCFALLFVLSSVIVVVLRNYYPCLREEEKR